MSIVESLKLLEKNAKRRRARRNGPDLQEVWHNCKLYVRAQDSRLLYPIVTRKENEEYGYSLTLHLPTGLSDISFRSRQHLLCWALGGDVEVEPRNNKLLLKVLTGHIPEFCEYRIGGPPGMCQPVPIGITREKGVTYLDLARAPHLLIGGGSGFGKSTWLHGAICCLLRAQVQLYIIDLKCLEFALYEEHARCAFSESDAIEILREVEKEMERRMVLLKGARVVKVQDYQGELPYIVVVIDEIAELQSKAAWGIINRLVRLARALGISIVAAVQRPATTVIDGDTRALFTARLAFQCVDTVNSKIIIDGPQAAYLPAIPGRGIYKLGDRAREVQTMYLKVTEGVEEVLSTIPKSPPVSTTVKTKPAP